jgi:hypothetical protein
VEREAAQRMAQAKGVLYSSPTAGAGRDDRGRRNGAAKWGGTTGGTAGPSGRPAAAAEAPFRQGAARGLSKDKGRNAMHGQDVIAG